MWWIGFLANDGQLGSIVKGSIRIPLRALSFLCQRLAARAAESSGSNAHGLSGLAPCQRSRRALRGQCIYKDRGHPPPAQGP
jgi:hypothetical protein